MCIALDLAVKLIWCVGIQGIYVRLTGGSRSHSGCSGMQGIYAQLTGEIHLLLYICIVLDLAVGCTSMQGLCNGLTGGPSVFYIYALY